MELFDFEIKKRPNISKKCSKIQKNKMGYNLKLLFTSSEQFECICVDILDPLQTVKGYSYMLGIIDVYKRYFAMISIKDINARKITEKK